MILGFPISFFDLDSEVVDDPDGATEASAGSSGTAGMALIGADGADRELPPGKKAVAVEEITHQLDIKREGRPFLRLYHKDGKEEKMYMPEVDDPAKQKVINHWGDVVTNLEDTLSKCEREAIKQKTQIEVMVKNHVVENEETMDALAIYRYKLQQLGVSTKLPTHLSRVTLRAVRWEKDPITEGLIRDAIEEEMQTEGDGEVETDEEVKEVVTLSLIHISEPTRPY